MLQRGVSMLEMLLVIVIAATIITISVRYYKVTSDNMEITQAVNEIKMLTSASYEWLAAERQVDFCGNGAVGCTEISMQELIDADLIPDTDHYTKTPWGTDITIQPATPASYVRISFELPLRFCANLEQRLKSINQVSSPCSTGSPPFIFKGAF